MDIIFKNLTPSELNQLISEGKIVPVHYQISQESLDKLINDGKVLKSENGVIFSCSSEEITELVISGLITPDVFDTTNLPTEDKARLFREEKIVAQVVVDVKSVQWNPTTERDPRVTGNNNRAKKSGGGFPFSPYFHKRGLGLQNVIKSGIIAFIGKAHKQIIKDYDSDAYQFDDPQLQEMAAYLRAFCSENFVDEGSRKITFMSQLLDIFLFLMKEDIYYRARFKKLLAGIPKESLVLTDYERENIETWH